MDAALETPSPTERSLCIAMRNMSRECRTKPSIRDLGWKGDSPGCGKNVRTSPPLTLRGGFWMPIPSEDTACALGFPTGENLRVRRELMAQRDTITTTPPSFAASISSSLSSSAASPLAAAAAAPRF